MKILTFKRLFLLSAIGGVAYVHKQRGGDWTFDSLKGTLRHLAITLGDKLSALDQGRGSLDRSSLASNRNNIGRGSSPTEAARPGAPYGKPGDTSRH